MIQLNDAQRVAVSKMHNGCILCGGVGSGKTRTSLAYYYQSCGGNLDSKVYADMRRPKDLYVITTAKKRDSTDWEWEMAPFMLTTVSEDAYYKGQTVVVDSWNNIQKYVGIKDAFFIFDEQRVIGYGAWTKAFLKIASQNAWILLSATPGDTWLDYAPVFIANGFYRNITEFRERHVIYDWKVKSYPKVKGYFDTKRLERLRDRLLVDIEVERETTRHLTDVLVQYDVAKYKTLMKNRWDVARDAPIDSAARLCYLLRQLINSDESRSVAVLEILDRHPKAIIFYSFDYELEILRNLGYPEGTEIAEWNGHLHQDIPGGDKWVYLVQYTAGNEGWNCITTDTIIFYSQQYSYRVLEQCMGRIDRINNIYFDLYYYTLRSRAQIDMAIARALKEKRNFNEGRFVNRARTRAA